MERATIRPESGQRVMTSDGVDLGVVEADERTHLRVRVGRTDGPTEHLFVPVSMVGVIDGETVHLNVPRDHLHEAVYALAPAQQREYATLGLSVSLGRGRNLQGSPEAQ